LVSPLPFITDAELGGVVAERNESTIIDHYRTITNQTKPKLN